METQKLHNAHDFYAAYSEVHEVFIDIYIEIDVDYLVVLSFISRREPILFLFDQIPNQKRGHLLVS